MLLAVTSAKWGLKQYLGYKAFVKILTDTTDTEQELNEY